MLPHLPPRLTCKDPGVQPPIRWFFRGASLLSSLSAGFPDRVGFLASTPGPGFTGLLCGEQSELGLGNSDFGVGRGTGPREGGSHKSPFPSLRCSPRWCSLAFILLQTLLGPRGTPGGAPGVQADTGGRDLCSCSSRRSRWGGRQTGAERERETTRQRDRETGREREIERQGDRKEQRQRDPS